MSNPTKITAPEGLPFILVEREFDSPVEAVWRAHNDAELLSQWMGPHGMEMEVLDFDPSDGGSYSFVHRMDGQEFGFRGVFHTVRENELIIQTWEFLGFPDHPSLERLEFIDLGNGRTKLNGQSTLDSVEARDGLIDSGMEKGLVEGYERLDALLN